MSNLSFIPTASPLKPAQDLQLASVFEKKPEFGGSSFDQFLKSANEKQFKTDSFQEKPEQPRFDDSKAKPEPKKDELKTADQSHSEKVASPSKPDQEADVDGEAKETSGTQGENTAEKVTAETGNEAEEKVETPGDVKQEEILALLAQLAEAEAVIRGETQPETVQMAELSEAMADAELVEGVQAAAVGDGNKIEGAKLVEIGSEIPVVNATEANVKSLKLNPEISTEGKAVEFSQVNQVLTQISGSPAQSEGESLADQGQNPDAKGQISELVKVNSNANLKTGNEGQTFDESVSIENQKVEATSQLGGNQVLAQHDQASEKGGKVNLALIQTHLAVNDAPEAKTEMPTMNIVPSQPAVSNTIQAPTSGTTGAASTNREELFSQLVDHAKVVLNNGGSEMEVNLRPEHLGKIQLKVTIENEVVTAKFVAESQQVKEIIESNLGQLKRNLQESGMEVDAIMVSVGNHQGSEGFEQAAGDSDRSSNFRGRSELVGDDLVLDDESQKPLVQSDTVIDLIA